MGLAPSPRPFSADRCRAASCASSAAITLELCVIVNNVESQLGNPSKAWACFRSRADASAVRFEFFSEKGVVLATLSATLTLLPARDHM